MPDIPKSDLPALCAAVGFITINWALMERQMDNIIHFSFDSFGGISGHDRKPSTFKEKAKYLIKAFSHTREFSNHKVNTLALIERAKSFSITRHAFTHGALESLDGTVLTINKLQTKKEYRVDLIKIDIKDFPFHAQEISDLVTEWLHLSKTLYDEHQKRKQSKIT
ncbi:hypothetical protein [Methyloradius palustris]|uniref:Uncharacterized protein n=1 Tax=Methyloradius palustris TaxID=2778876 RepID=A0A8D5JZ51_9PROT|nr:hypothetical protein [Methyloradius palustris]BCM25332.1 hypothetical protein ZMTM_15910 [Methyloradius palustris]